MENNNTASEVDVQAVTVGQIEKVYVGRIGRCCCGCAGKYVAPEANGTGDYPVDPQHTLAVLRKVQAAWAEGKGDNCGTSFFSAEVGKKLLVVYLKPAAKEVA